MLHVENVSVTDGSFFFLPPPTDIPSTVSFDIMWTAFGKVRHLRPSSSEPTDPTNFAGEFRFATATGSLSGRHSDCGFTFESPDATSEGLFAEMGTERNGVFLH